MRAGCPPRCAYNTRNPGAIRPERTRSISAAIDFPFINRIREDSLEPSAQAYRLDRLRIRNPVRAGVPLVEQDNLVVAQLAAEADCIGGLPCDAAV